MKGFLKFLLAVIFIAGATWYASSYNYPIITFAVLAVSLCAVIFFSRASILMFLGSYIYRQNAEAGLKVMTIAYNTHKLNPSFQLIYAYLVLRSGNLDEAETIMNKATVIGKHALRDEEFKAVAFNKALITWKRGNLSQAIVELEELQASGYSTPAFYGSLGSFYILNKEFDKALELSKKAVEANSTDLVSLDNMGEAYIGLGMYDEALEIYKSLIPKKPSFMEAYYNYAVILEKKGILDKAKYNYETALTYDEKFLSTITHDEICEAIERVDTYTINNVKIEDIVYEGVTQTTTELSDEEEKASLEPISIETYETKEEPLKEDTEDEDSLS